MFEPVGKVCNEDEKNTAADNATRFRPYRLTESEEFVKIIVSRSNKISTLTNTITKLAYQ